MQIPFSINAVCRQTQNHNKNEIFLFSEQSELCCICLYYFGIERTRTTNVSVEVFERVTSNICTQNADALCKCTMQMQLN